jgi:hypothetical protein
VAAVYVAPAGVDPRVPSARRAGQAERVTRAPPNTMMRPVCRARSVKCTAHAATG